MLVTVIVSTLFFVLKSEIYIIAAPYKTFRCDFTSRGNKTILRYDVSRKGVFYLLKYSVIPMDQYENSSGLLWRIDGRKRTGNFNAAEALDSSEKSAYVFNVCVACVRSWYIAWGFIATDQPINDFLETCQCAVLWGLRNWRCAQWVAIAEGIGYAKNVRCDFKRVNEAMKQTAERSFFSQDGDSPFYNQHIFASKNTHMITHMIYLYW